MAKLEDALERIKILECPTGDVESRVLDIFQEYGVAGRDEVNVHREKSLDQEDRKAYVAEIHREGDHAIVVLAKSGMDDYVATVVDAYLQ